MKLPSDPIILELLPEFLDDWNQQLEANFMAYIRAHDEHEVYRIGHTLKGSCFQFGLDDIAQMGITLMTHARAHDWANVEAMYEPIVSAFRNATIEVKSQLNL
jgi:HPt (histidine-containing phosphotransfer) domain-containing protein